MTFSTVGKKWKNYMLYVCGIVGGEHCCITAEFVAHRKSKHATDSGRRNTWKKKNVTEWTTLVCNCSTITAAVRLHATNTATSTTGACCSHSTYKQLLRCLHSVSTEHNNLLIRWVDLIQTCVFHVSEATGERSYSLLNWYNFCIVRHLKILKSEKIRWNIPYYVDDELIKFFFVPNMQDSEK